MTVGMSFFWRAAARQPGARCQPPKSLGEINDLGGWHQT
jgi:hypothetical protein